MFRGLWNGTKVRNVERNLESRAKNARWIRSLALRQAQGRLFDPLPSGKPREEGIAPRYAKVSFMFLLFGRGA